MSTINLDFDVDRPLSEVWQFGHDSKRITEWQYDISSVKDVTGPMEGVGHVYTLVYRMWERDFDSPVQITRFEPPHTMENGGVRVIRHEAGRNGDYWKFCVTSTNNMTSSFLTLGADLWSFQGHSQMTDPTPNYPTTNAELWEIIYEKQIYDDSNHVLSPALLVP